MGLLIFFYDFWEIVNIMGIMFGLLGRFVPRLPRTKRDSDNRLKILRRICYFTAILLIGFSAFLHIVCVKVPNVVGMDLSEARSLLRGRDLEDELLPNKKYDNVSVNAEVNFQSISDIVVFKNTTVFLDFVQGDIASSKSDADRNNANRDNSLDVSHGNEEKVSVPNVLGMEQGEAIRTLYMAGLQFQVF